MWQKIKNIYHLFVAISANIAFGFSGEKLVVIGVTGTDGKTTTVNLIYHILSSAGMQASMVSTVGAKIHGKSLPLGFHVTNPGSWQLQEFLQRAAKSSKKPNYMVLEITSHGIDQNRIWGIPFAVAGITNITHEHLDYHKTFDNYLQTKVKLLQKAKLGFINKDDLSFEKIVQILGSESQNIFTYSLNLSADVTARGNTYIDTLMGEYNQSNALLAISICEKLGLSKEIIKKGVKSFVFPEGRTEIVYKKDFTIMIDFAHTPNAFEQLLKTIRPKVKGKIIHVFGSAGKRDFTKRPKMGKFVNKYDDIVILTAEDPRDENLDEINKAIKLGITNKKITILEIKNRQEAIVKAVSLAKKGDFVLLTGKAHEKSINLGNGEEPWDEYSAVEKALKYAISK